VVEGERGPMVGAIPEFDPSVTILKRKLLLLLLDCILVCSNNNQSFEKHDI